MIFYLTLCKIKKFNNYLFKESNILFNKMTNIIDILNNGSDNKLVKKFNKKKSNSEKNKLKQEEKSLEGRIPKTIKYANERKVVLNKLLKILDINETNIIFYVDDLKKNEDKQKQILDLVDDVKQYFVCGKWVYFAKKNVPESYLSLAKSILKDMNYNLSSFYPKDNNTKTKRKALVLENK